MAKLSSSPAGLITIQDVHRQLYGTVPPKLGTAYERLAAAVFAHLGWVDVEHDQFESTPGGSAEHQLDFVCRHPDGSVAHLMAQCKHWMQKVGKPEMDTLFGVQTQLQWDAAVVITQVGFTRGARRVAADQDIAMVILRPYDPATDDGRWWRGVRTTISWPFTSVTDVKLHPANAPDAPALAQVRVESWMSLWHGPAKKAETFGEFWAPGPDRAPA
jgi:predicted helicase